MDSRMDKLLYHCDKDTYKLFNYYLSEIGIDLSYPAKGISPEHVMDYCIKLVEAAKAFGNKKAKAV